jgi:hypothetical protein
MPILMKHSGNAAAAVAGEYGAGQGKRSWEGANAELAQQRQQENIDYTYSAQQRAEFNKLAEAGSQAAASGDFTPDELKDIRREIIAKQAGIQPLPRMSKASAYPTDRGPGQSWVADDGTGTVLTRDEKGQQKVLYKGTNLPDVKDTADLYKQATAALTRMVGTNTELPKPEEVEAYVMNAFRMHQKLRNMASGKGDAQINPNAVLDAALGGDQAVGQIDPNAALDAALGGDQAGDQIDTKGMLGIPGVGLPAASPDSQPDTAAIEEQTAKIIATLPPEQAKVVRALVPKNADQARNQERILATVQAVNAEYPLWSADKKRAEVKKRMEKEFGVTDL